VWYWHSHSGDWEFYDNPGFQPRTGDPLQIITRDAIAKWQEERTKHEQALQAQETRREAAALCDELAANPNDRRRTSAGVPYEELKMRADEAVEACANAADANPKQLRFQYQLARALEFVNRAKALEIHGRLVKAKYPAAYDNMGWLIYADKKNPSQAVKYFRMGVELGDPDSMVSLADMIDRAVYSPPNAPFVKLSLYKRAAQLGHQGAAQAYEIEMQRQQQLQQQLQQRQLTEQEMQRRMIEAFGMILRSIPRR
jgi:TPR repeat protein